MAVEKRKNYLFSLTVGPFILHLLWRYYELLILPGDIPDNAVLNSASLTHFPPVGSVCVCVGSGTQVYLRKGVGGICVT